MTKPLDLERFKELLAAYGGKLERFPVHERAAALALLERFEEARAAMAAEAELDEIFATSAAPELSSELSRKLTEIPVRHPRAERRSRFAGLFTGLAWAAAAAIGVVWGVHSEALDHAERGDDSVENAASTGEDEQLETDAELVELALGAVSQLEEEP
jgi:hypothetical protein